MAGVPLRVTYDPVSDVAHIYLTPPRERGYVAQMYPIDDLPNVQGDINLDFDAEGRLVGIGVLKASRVLPPDLLAQASAPGEP